MRKEKEAIAMKKSARRFWKNLKTGLYTMAPASRDLSKHGLWIEVSYEEYLKNKED